jgi:hypothetical protein
MPIVVLVAGTLVFWVIYWFIRMGIFPTTTAPGWGAAIPELRQELTGLR